MTKTKLGTERETERRLPVSRNLENYVMRNVFSYYILDGKALAVQCSTNF